MAPRSRSSTSARESLPASVPSRSISAASARRSMISRCRSGLMMAVAMGFVLLLAISLSTREEAKVLPHARSSRAQKLQAEA